MLGFFTWLFNSKKKVKQQPLMQSFPQSPYPVNRNISASLQNDVSKRKVKPDDSSSDMLDSLNPLSPLYFANQDYGNSWTSSIADSSPSFEGFGGGDFGGSGSGGNWDPGSSYDSGSPGSFD